VSEELTMTLEALEELYMARRDRGWSVRVYDYGSNTWREGGEAFRTSGTYERAVLTGPGTSPVRVRLMPRGRGMLLLDAASAKDVGVWRALGVDLKGRHLEVIGELLEGHEGSLPVEELARMLASTDDPVAREALEALAPLLPRGGGGP